MSEDDYEDLMRLRDLKLRLNAGNGNDEAKGGEPRDQRAMGFDEGQHFTPGKYETYNARFRFTGQNIEEFQSRFKHACKAMQVADIFFTNYGSDRPNANTEQYRTW